MGLWPILFLSGMPAGDVQASSGILSSQVGYEPGDPVRVMVRSDEEQFLSSGARFDLLNRQGKSVLRGPLRKWGEKWGSFWWVADLSDCGAEGTYVVVVRDGPSEVMRSDPIVIRRGILRSSCFQTIARDFLDTRAEQARTKMGWRDCGSDLQEFSSHAVAVDGLCDLYEISSKLSRADRRNLLKHIGIGCTYLAHLQDRAEQLGLGRGPVLHEDRQDHVVTGNVAKAAMIFGRASRILKDSDPRRSAEYLLRAHRAYRWISTNGPILNEEEQKFYPQIHGAPSGSVPPRDQWMTRDLLMMARAALELYRGGRREYQEIAVAQARHVMSRQVPEDRAEGGLHGHFYTYGDYSSFGNVRFTEKANIHCGAWSKEGRIYNKGGHYPHHLIPLMEMLSLWPRHRDAGRWKECLRNFAYGYFLPACRRSPFLILPSGYYRGEGLIYFGSWYHGHNNIYGFAASLALELGKLFQDPQFREIATGNVQWIAGLNCGILEGRNPPRYRAISMISGVGSRYRGSWTGIPGSICNGFSASEQFRVVPATARGDRPSHLDDEAYIAHSLPFLAALARLGEE